MPLFLSVVPSIRTPFGVDVFDYRLDDESDVRPGDLIRVPFRKNLTPSLVVSVSSSSAFADRAVGISDVKPLIRLPLDAIRLLERTAFHAFASRPTVLQSWIRNIPQRAPFIESHMTNDGIETTNDLTEYVLDRSSRIIEHAKRLSGRVLILTPWQRRAETLAKQLSTESLHAETPMSRAWSAWTSFVASKDKILVATRIGGWLASCADAVIIDEPENDDFKQDELSPRIDARMLVEATKKYRPSLSVIRVGTTPSLSTVYSLRSTDFPMIDVPFTSDAWSRQSWSDVNGVNVRALNSIEEAVNEKRPVIIIHPLHGDESRVVCRDCRWTAVCGSCGFGVSREGSQGRCHRCGHNSSIPEVCPTCGSADLSRGRIGKDRLASQIAGHFPGAEVSVIDLPCLHSTFVIRHSSLVILTDISLIGGFSEDIRRREKLAIAWRRLAAAVAHANGNLIAQGPEELLDQARNLLSAEGLERLWTEEWRDREQFGYPPATRRIKMLVDGDAQAAETLLARLRDALPQSWDIQGPFPVLFRAKTRKQRHAIHLLPPKETTEDMLHAALSPFAKDAIIDLDPIAFFS